MYQRSCTASLPYNINLSSICMVVYTEAGGEPWGVVVFGVCVAARSASGGHTNAAHDCDARLQRSLQRSPYTARST